MTLSARNVTRDCLRALMDLSVLPEQDKRVAPNSVTLAQAAYETGSTVYGLWDEDQAVGLMAVIDMKNYPWIEEADEKDGLYLWRLMIDKDRQGKGFGRAALDLLVEIAQEHNAVSITSSVVQEEGSAMPFYETYGFVQTGEIHDDELVIRLVL